MFIVLVLLSGCSPIKDATSPEDTGGAPCTTVTAYDDADFDGYGDSATAQEVCEDALRAGLVALDGDCDEADPSVHPGAVEQCDGRDEDCDGEVDDDLEWFTAWRDVDHDGYGDPEQSAEVCGLPDGWVLDDTDCDDTRPLVNPAAEERCDDQDNDCDGLIDDEDASVVPPSTWFEDLDGDGWGGGAGLWACDRPEGWVDLDGDCEDGDPSINPDADELCFDGIDQDCDGSEDCVPDLGQTSGQICGSSTTPMDQRHCGSGVVAVRPTGDTYPTLQAAIDAAGDGETITICPGSWAGSATLSRTTTLVGFGAGVSVLVGDGGRILSMQAPTASLTLMDLGFEGGSHEVGGAISADIDQACFGGVSFTDNTARFGGAIDLAANDAVVEDSSFLRNTADYGGALYADAPLRFKDCVIADNSANNLGGVLYLNGGRSRTEPEADLRITGSLFQGNSSRSGGVLHTASDVELRTIGSEFRGNTASSGGGVFSVEQSTGSRVRAWESLFEGNTAGVAGSVVELTQDARAVVGFHLSELDANVSTVVSLRGDGPQVVVFDHSTITDNSADRRPSVLEMSPPDSRALFNACEVLRNRSTGDGPMFSAVPVPMDSTVVSVHTDWGTGADDNLPFDVRGEAFGEDASFTCTPFACR